MDITLLSCVEATLQGVYNHVTRLKQGTQEHCSLVAIATLFDTRLLATR